MADQLPETTKNTVRQPEPKNPKIPRVDGLSRLQRRQLSPDTRALPLDFTLQAPVDPATWLHLNTEHAHGGTARFLAKLRREGNGSDAISDPHRDALHPASNNNARSPK